MENVNTILIVVAIVAFIINIAIVIKFFQVAKDIRDMLFAVWDINKKIPDPDNDSEND